MKRVWAIVFVLAVVWIAAMLHRGQPLGWDEVEFFRATKWTGEGKVPFRDFWEHHTPLQWLLFAPIARLFGGGPGAGSIVALRWAQFAMWIATLALVLRLARDGARWWALTMLLVCPLFVRSAIEYRVDALGNFFFIAAIVVAVKRRWIAFGALMSLAVLANMRLAPLVVFTGALMLFWAEERWRWYPGALRMLIGVVAVALPFVGWLMVTHAWQPFLDGVFRYNAASSALMTHLHTLADQMLAPVYLLDPAAIALWIGAIVGCVLALRRIKRPGVPQIVAILFLASIAVIVPMEVQYEYHFQNTYLLMVPLAALACMKLAPRWYWLVLTIAGVALLLNLLPLASPAFGEPMRYQDAVMREVDRRTKPGDKVFDGTGYALRREPAYPYWFLPVGVRYLAEVGKAPRFNLALDPPAAIIYNTRMLRWFETFPADAAYAVHHYVPLTRDLWMPGMTAILPPDRPITWIAPAAGRYTLWTSEPLVRHPWLTKPLEYAHVRGPLATRYAIPLQRLPVATQVQWAVDGFPTTARTVELRKGSRVTLLSREARPVGALLVPSDVQTLCVGPGEEFQF